MPGGTGGSSIAARDIQDQPGLREVSRATQKSLSGQVHQCKKGAPPTPFLNARGSLCSSCPLSHCQVCPAGGARPQLGGGGPCSRQTTACLVQLIFGRGGFGRKETSPPHPRFKKRESADQAKLSERGATVQAQEEEEGASRFWAGKAERTLEAEPWGGGEEHRPRACSQQRQQLYLGPSAEKCSHSAKTLPHTWRL